MWLVLVEPSSRRCTKRFYGLRERPFDLTPNPRYLYLTGSHREALGNLQYGITGRKGMTLLIGEAGTGKTTIVHAALDAVAGPSVRCVYLSNPVLTRQEFYEFLSQKFGLSAQAAVSKARFLFELEAVLLERHRAGGLTALVIDEAQSLPHDLLEEVRLLANFETETDKLLPVVLAGQPELASRLEHEELRQFKQRVALRCDLAALDLRETAAYISGRIAIAGGDSARVFTREAVQVIYERSARHPPDDQRHLRQRASDRVCGRRRDRSDRPWCWRSAAISGCRSSRRPRSGASDPSSHGPAADAAGQRAAVPAPADAEHAAETRRRAGAGGRHLRPVHEEEAVCVLWLSLHTGDDR